MDKIILKGLKFYGYHGVTAQEKEKGQEFLVDIRMNVDLAKAAQSDEIFDSVDYHAIYKRINEVVAGNSCNLLETLATKIAAKVLESEKVQDVTVRVRKSKPPIKGELKWVGVEVTRARVNRE